MGGLGAFTREDVFQDWHYWLTRYWILLRVVRTSHSPSFVGRGTHCLLKRGTQNEFFWERRYNWSILKDTSYNWPNNTSRQYNLPIVHLIFSFLTWYFSNVTSFPSSIPIMTQYAFHNSPAYPLSVQYAPAILGGGRHYGHNKQLFGGLPLRKQGTYALLWMIEPCWLVLWEERRSQLPQLTGEAFQLIHGPSYIYNN